MSLSVKNITKRFGDKIIFNGFSYDFDSTGVYLIRGESGIGKTTLLRMIAGLDKDYDGQIIGGGVDKVSFHFQEHRLFPTLNVIENALIGNDSEKDSFLVAKKHLLRLGFTENELTQFPHELSGGMKQRVAFVRSIMKKCDILLLDEPTKELDDKLCSVMTDMINEEAQVRLVIMVSHRSDDDRLADLKIITI